MRILHLDSNHEILASLLEAAGHTNVFDHTSSKEEVQDQLHEYDGLVVRSRFPIDDQFLSHGKNIKVIGRVGAGLENIDLQAAARMGIVCHNAPEGNRNAVGGHALALLLDLLNNITRSNNEVKNGSWRREANRGVELDSLTIGLIGYGNNGKAFARKLSGFDCTVLCHDILPDLGNEHATQVSLTELQERCDVISLHVPDTPLTRKLINRDFIQTCGKSFWLINCARGSCVVTADLVEALDNGSIRGAGLDVLEYEKSSFENFFTGERPAAFNALLENPNVILTPHVAGWTVESKERLARVIAEKMIATLAVR